MAMRSEPTMFPGRDSINPQAGRDCVADLYRQAGVTNPRKEIDVAEIYVPFSWYEPMWMENLGFAELDEGWKMTDEGATAFDGDMPVNASGGVLSTNPIGASGMLRCAEAALQVRGMAVRAREEVSVVATDATSIAAYEKRKLSVQARLLSDPQSAQGLANHLLDYYKDPLNEVGGIEILANKDATWMAAVRDLELMDRIVITETQTGLSAYAGYIYKMNHKIKSRYEHYLTFDVETAYTISGTPFTIESSTFDSGHILIY